MIGLTRRQRFALDVIRDHIAAHGLPPTLREIGAVMRIGSTNGVNDHLRALEAKGAIVRDAMKSRAIALTDALDPFEGVRCVDFGGVLAQIDDEDVWSVIDCETDDVIGDHLTRAEAFALARHTARVRAIPDD